MVAMQYDSETNLELSCLECEHCHSCRSGSDIFCKHPFVVSPVEGRPGWGLGDIGHRACLTPEWCPGMAQNAPALGHLSFTSESADQRYGVVPEDAPRSDPKPC
jgi:hypothetical protein